MSYSTSSPPILLVPSFNDQSPSIWTYASTDGATTVDAAGYITNGAALGMKAGDIVIVTDTDASPVVTTTHRVVSVTAGGSADLSDLGATLGSTNSD